MLLLITAIVAITNFYTAAEAFCPSSAKTHVSSSMQTSTYLKSQNGETIIIGGGRIGSLISQDAKLFGRNDPISTSIDANGSGPIFIATRNDVLGQIVDDCPASRKKDLVFLQNGFLDDFLESKGLLDNTQVLLYLAVTALGAGKSALVLFHDVNPCFQYEVSVSLCNPHLLTYVTIYSLNLLNRATRIFQILSTALLV